MLLTGTELCNCNTCTRLGCGPQTGCQGHARRDAMPEIYRRQIHQVVADMERDGLVLTVEQVPLQPLAMGNHYTRVTVRQARERAKP